MADKSMCELRKRSEIEDKSLGIFKPTNIEFYWTDSQPVNEEKRKLAYLQRKLFKRPIEPIEKIPYDFRYKFFCQNEDTCQGHDFLIIDWEIFEAYRKWKSIY
jgi:hypothetical protein